MYTKKLNTNKGHNYNIKTTSTERNNISPPAKKEGGEKLREAALEEQKKSQKNGQSTNSGNIKKDFDKMSPAEKNKEAIGYCLHHITEIQESIKENTRTLNQILEQIAVLENKF